MQFFVFLERGIGVLLLHIDTRRGNFKEGTRGGVTPFSRLNEPVLSPARVFYIFMKIYISSCVIQREFRNLIRERERERETAPRGF